MTCIMLFIKNRAHHVSRVMVKAEGRTLWKDGAYHGDDGVQVSGI